jgi:hypothetical protein
VKAISPGGTEKVTVSVVVLELCSVNESEKPTENLPFAITTPASNSAPMSIVCVLEKVNPVLTLLA